MKKIITMMLAMAALSVGATEKKYYVDGLFYELIGGDGAKTAQVVSAEYSEFPDGFPEGDIVVPETVAIEGESYKVTNIGDGALYFDMEKRKIYLPSSIAGIGNAAFGDYIQWGFAGNERTVEMAIPESVEIIGTSGLSYINAQEELNLPNIKKIYACGLYNVSSRKIALGPELKVVGNGAFVGCELDELVFEDELAPRSDDSPMLARRAFNEIKLKELKMPKWEHMRLGDCVGFNCRILERVIFPDIKTIEYCYNDGPSGEPWITLTPVIYGYFFMSCPKLKEMVCLGDIPPQITNIDKLDQYRGILQRGTDTFDFMDNMDGCVLKVPAGSEALYRAHPVWGRFQTILGFENGDYNLVSINSVEADKDVTPVYYNLQGIQVKEPVKGQLYIRKAGAETTKVIM